MLLIENELKAFSFPCDDLYVPISKSQLNSDVNSRANFQEMQIPLCFT